MMLCFTTKMKRIIGSYSFKKQNYLQEILDNFSDTQQTLDLLLVFELGVVNQFQASRTEGQLATIIFHLSIHRV